MASVSPKLSVVITTFNHGNFLADAIDSVLKQTVPCDEIVVVDDGSVDATETVVARYPQVQYIYQQNRGPSAARNTGLKASKGEYVVFLDADDVLEPVALATGEAHLAAHPDWAFVSGGHRRVDQNLQQLGDECCWPVHSDHYKALLRSNYIGMHATVMYRRAVLQAIGGFDEQLRGCEDLDIYLRISRIQPVGSHGERIASYRQHGSNSSHGLENMFTTALKVQASQYQFVKDDPGLRAAWREGLRNWRIYFGDRILQQFRSNPSSFIGSPTQLRLLLQAAAGYPFIWKHLRNSRVRPRNVVRALRKTLSGLRRAAPPPRPVEWGSLRSTAPLNREEPANSVVARYVQNFLNTHASDLTDGEPSGPDDYALESVERLPSGSQSLITCILRLRSFDPGKEVAELGRVLKPAGVLLAVLPGAALRSDAENGDGYWRFTTISARRIFEQNFPGVFEIAHCGNVLTSTAALHRLPADSLTEEEFATADSQHQLLVTIRAVRT